jgi:hypothetical protein
MNWPDVVAAARNGVLGKMIDRARLVERGRPNSEHLKRSDDATVLAVEDVY